MFSQEQLNVIKYCAEECERQASGEVSVYDMLNAWNSTLKMYYPDKPVSLDVILFLGALVEPEENKDGFRTHAIGITDNNAPFGVRPIGSDWHEIERHLKLLLDSYYEGVLEPGTAKETKNLSKSPEDEFYFLYESIHPFGDGNGRTGKIIYNYLCGTLDNPILPPNFFGMGLEGV